MAVLLTSDVQTMVSSMQAMPAASGPEEPASP